MADRSKFFRVAVEGGTTDGRKIERSWLTDIAATFDRNTYGARVNMEHIRGYSAEPPFNAYGDVLAVKVEEVTIQLGGKPEKRLALFAQIAPTDALIRLNKAKQKLYSSVEIDPDFAGTGKAYLVGLAITDSPASLGTELLAFAAGGSAEAAHVKAALDARKQRPDNVISAAAEEFSLELETTAVLTNPGEVTLAGLIAGVAVKLGLQTPTAPNAVVASSPQATSAPALAVTPGGQGGTSDGYGLVAAQIQAMAAGFDQLRAADRQKLATLSAAVKSLTDKLDNTPLHASRPIAAGAPAQQQTDC